MDPIPDAWPPAGMDGLGGLTGTVPVFPLPGVFLFPRQLMPLHIFEPRYRAMIEDSLDGPGRLVLATLLEGAERDQDRPALLPVAGLGQIEHHEKLADGRFLIWLFGMARVRIHEVESDRAYRRVQFEELSEASMAPETDARLREPLTRAILSRMDTFLNLPEDVPIGLLSDLLSQRMELSQAQLASIFSETDPARRAELALEAHDAHPPARDVED